MADPAKRGVLAWSRKQYRWVTATPAARLGGDGAGEHGSGAYRQMRNTNATLN
jgi:hypothetical protein